MSDYTQEQEIVIGPCLIIQEPSMEMTWTLTFYTSDPQLQEVARILQRVGVGEKGHTWKSYIEHIFHDKSVRFECEFSMVSASCDTQETLLHIATMIQGWINNPDQLRAEIAQQAPKQTPQSLISIDVLVVDAIGNPQAANRKPYLVKTLAHNAHSIVTQSRHSTEEEAIAALQDLEKNAPGVYTRVTIYRMRKEASAT